MNEFANRVRIRVGAGVGVAPLEIGGVGVRVGSFMTRLLSPGYIASTTAVVLLTLFKPLPANPFSVCRLL